MDKYNDIVNEIIEKQRIISVHFDLQIKFCVKRWCPCRRRRYRKVFITHVIHHDIVITENNDNIE